MTTEVGIPEGRGWGSLPESFRSTARERCTAKQLDALKLAAAGYGAKRAGRILDISPEAYRARLDGAMRKLRDELGEVDG